uniref:Uncharacterized protein n=1 Tax=Botrytis cinerea mycovirus 5 TaxID=2735930 RepID=A0A858YCH1_9VIRU|nr:hypothetical protein [Botrytis cinerea mycovirus 5]
MADMRQMFGGSTRDVQFGQVPGLEGKRLPVPGRNDTLTQLAAKMADLRKVVESGHSLAVATGMKAAAFQTVNPVEKARAEMGVAEREMYDAWRGGVRLQDFDKATSRTGIDKWRGSMPTLDKWVAGLRAMYDDPTLEREHAVWFASKAAFMVPTITAHVKVLMAGKAMVDQEGHLSPEEMAEYQSAKRILADAAFRVQQIKREINNLTQEIGRAEDVVITRVRHYQQIKREINNLTQEIGRAEDVVITRVRHYQQKVGTKEHKEAPENRNRKRRGLPSLGAPTDLGGMTGQGREARRRRVDLDLGGHAPAQFATATYEPQSPTFEPASPTGRGGAGPSDSMDII